MSRRIVLLAVTACAAALLPAQSASAQAVSFSCSPGPVDCSGWHREAVRLTWSVAPEYDTEGCDNQTYATDTPGVQNRCRATSGTTTVDVTVTIRVDQTAPVVTGAVPERPPDHEGWFTRPAALQFTGSDATSGLAGCTRPTYAGADGADVTVAGTCSDVAGNISAPLSVPLRYDATAPAVTLGCTGADRRVECTWTVSADAVGVELTRAPASNPGVRSTVYAGTGAAFTDRYGANGARSVYELTAVDAAGNRASATAVAGPARTLLGPSRGAKLTAPPLLSWTAVSGARYYNVQLFRGRRKVLSAWPTRAQLQLERTWRYGGRRRHLRPGVYRWYVWPGRGRRAAHQYGPLIGRRTFRIG